MGKTFRTLIARNAESFSFLYQETIDSFENVSFFDPEHDVPCLDDVDLLYLPGGYPEKHVDALVKNEACRKAVKAFAERGGRIQAECGGMMYLCRSIVDDEGEWPMCDVLPYSITARKTDRRLSLGYRRFVLDGREYRGHEFHYTQIMRGEGQEVRGEGIVSAAQVYDAKGNPVDTPVFKYKNVLASYTHVYSSVECRVDSVEFATASGGCGERTAVANSKLSTLNSTLNPDAAANSKLSTLNSTLNPDAAANSKLSTLNSTLNPDAVANSSLFTIHSKLNPVMFAGTGSDVGKSIIAAAFCRILKQDGYHPAPFKAQNMALNSYVTPDGLEIGRAQAVQAEAAGIPCHTDMNPLLLKPQSDHTSQVVLHGKPIGNKDAYDYWKKGNHNSCVPPVASDQRSSAQFPILRSTSGRSQGENSQLKKEVCAAFDRLSQRYNPIVMEGAGSISELNLRDTDLVNMPMARYAHANVILVADIDRGGVFASVYGSIALQTAEDRKRIKGIIINKFRGDLRLFEKGRQMLEDICGIPVLGVVPYFKDIHIEEEDSVSLEKKQRQLAEGKVNVAVVLLRHISNFTDFDTLERDPRVNLFYTNNTTDLAQSDIIILPGTKSTLDDLLELRRNGCAQAIVRAHREGKTVVGICGGYQMLGETIDDPDGIEGDITSLPGLGLLPIHTTMGKEKTTRQVTFQFEGHDCQGYEIHQGVSDTRQAILQTDHCIGTYLHGFLDNQPVIDYLLRNKAGSTRPTQSYADFKNQQYDLLADHVRRYVDMERFYQILSTDD